MLDMVYGRQHLRMAPLILGFFLNLTLLVQVLASSPTSPFEQALFFTFLQSHLPYISDDSISYLRAGLAKFQGKNKVISRDL